MNQDSNALGAINPFDLTYLKKALKVSLLPLAVDVKLPHRL